MTDYKITETEKAAHHLQNLSDRPNAMSSYREGKLSATGMKKLFDDNFDFISDKHNKLGEALEAEHDDRVEKHEELENKHVALENKHVALENKHVALENKHVALEKSHEKTAAQVETLISEPINRIYPIGAVYISFEATSPSVLFGGTWEELPSGRFLMASSGAAGTTGGSEYHMHGADTMVAEIAMDPNSSNVLQWNEVVTDNYIYYSTNKQLTLFNEPMGVSTGTCLGVKVIGSTSSESNIPPYITVHMWKRTS